MLESPFQAAEALVIVETPEGNRYEWLPVRGGSATYRLEVEQTWVPKLPVHFVLMRGRLAGTAPLPNTLTDLGKPATLAATAWITVVSNNDTCASPSLTNNPISVQPRMIPCAPRLTRSEMIAR